MSNLSVRVLLSVGAILILCGLGPMSAPAQDKTAGDIVGMWQGTLDTGPIKLRLLVKIGGTPGALTGTLDSIDQGAKEIPISEVTLQDDTLHLTLPSIGGTFEGKRSVDGTQFEGTWTQGGGSLPLTLSRTTQVPTLARRPQEPHPPYPYIARDVTFPNVKDNVTLAGTLTLPRGSGPFPAVVLIAGSGAHARDEEILGHKPFLVLADYLTRRGIAVLRYDKRGCGQSTGDYAKATSEDFTHDALAAVAFLKAQKQIASKHIGLIGHSEGGLIAPLAATRSSSIAFIVLMAGPGLTGEQILLRQSALIARAGGASEAVIAQEQRFQRQTYAIVKSTPDDFAARRKLSAMVSQATQSLTPEARAASQKQTDAQMETIISPWFRFFLTYDPAPTLARVHCPVLALNGSKDMQVPPAEDLAAIRKALKAGGNHDATVTELPGLNHLFQICRTGAPTEYAEIEQTISPKALQVIAAWIGKHTAEHARPRRT